RSLDDENGARQTQPLSPGDSGSLEITVTNNSLNDGFVSAWIDWNQDGDWSDAGEQVFSDVVVSSSTTTPTRVISPTFEIPANAILGTTFARVRLSQQSGLTELGFSPTGEVEDFRVQVTSGGFLQNDTFEVSRNTLSNTLDVLANDFQPDGTNLSVSSITRNNIVLPNGQTVSTRGATQLPPGGNSVQYTPPTNFVGLDYFIYSAENPITGLFESALVEVNVTFASANPIAVDDSFTIPQNTVNFPLNVLDNDIVSTAGGLSIISVTQPANGAVNVFGGGQSIRYTPSAGAAGTDEFMYTIVDSANNISTATVTVNLSPVTLDDDIVEFRVEALDAVNLTPLANDQVRVGDEFLVRITVDDLGRGDRVINLNGVASAYLDLLYDNRVIAPVLDGNGNPIITRGVFNQALDGDIDTPGLYNELGGTRAVGTGDASDPEILATIRVVAVAPGVATFRANPADDPQNETTVQGLNRAVAVGEQRLGTSTVTVVPNSNNFTSAIDDAFLRGVDSDGNAIQANRGAILRVLENDLLGDTGTIVEREIQNAAGTGTASFNDNSTPGDLSDDFVIYTPFNGDFTDSFTYTITTADGVRSTATVDIGSGNFGDNDLLEIAVEIVPDADGTLSPGDNFDVILRVDDLRDASQAAIGGVFAAYTDLLYDSSVVQVVAPNGDSDLEDFISNLFNDNTSAGTLVRRNVIDEFGAFQRDVNGEAGPLGFDPDILATIPFRVVGSVGDAVSIIASPADASPFQDSLLYDPPAPVDPDQIRYGAAGTLIVAGGGGTGGENTFHNYSNPYDVNQDGYISAVDVLLIVQRLRLSNRGGESGSQLDTSLKTDVNDDGNTSAIDAAMLLRELNTLSRGGELAGESIATP
ncbi:MAG: Ig-like domain-containing protein, partial [Planctomycetota bacterium]